MLKATKRFSSATLRPPPPAEALRHLTQEELADRWRISPRTLERWRWAGKGPAYLKLVGSVAYRIEDIEAYEAAQRQNARVQAERHLSKAERFARGMRG
jgi:hypothetical protein